MNEFLIGGGSACLTALVTWFFSRKKQSAEVESTEIDNIDKATAIWRELAEGLKDQVDELLEGQKSMRIEVQKLEKKVQSLTSENRKLRTLIEGNNCGTTE